MDLVHEYFTQNAVKDGFMTFDQVRRVESSCRGAVAIYATLVTSSQIYDLKTYTQPWTKVNVLLLTHMYVHVFIRENWKIGA